MTDLNYSQLATILRELGFERRVIQGSHVLFTHQSMETSELS
jgi:predicted RNA binding protein YcfA (HicA-like mRNA interferase family)